MKRYIILLVIFLSGLTQGVFSQKYNVSGSITDSKDKSPVGFATAILTDNSLWAVADGDGRFILKNVPAGKISVTFSCLGYVSTTIEIEVKGDITNLAIQMKEDNLALDEVVVTATQKSRELTTSYTIDRTTLDHSQILNASSISSLLPGGKSPTRQSLVSSDQRLTLRGGSNEMGNASFGSAIQVDGVRLLNNSTFEARNGIDLRNLSSTNIESVEVITGIPSVEHGDLSNGIVIFNTKKGKTPLTVELSTMPNTKQAAVNKGFSLGDVAGTINAGFEHTKSISDPASPYTSYDRNAFSVKYSNTLNKKTGMPLSIDAGFTGNLGGYNSKTDPDAYTNTYTKSKDNTFRGNINLKWLLNKPWITNIDLSGSVSYSDKLSETNSYKSSSSSQAAIHSMEEGYFIATKYDENPDAHIILTPAGSWYQLAFSDNKPIYFSTKLKADWSRYFGSVHNRIMIGGDLNSGGNKGRGDYYDDMRLAPTWREYRYDDKPYMNNIALYAEDKVTLPVGDSKLEVTAGLRSDITSIKNSEYGTVNSLSPRVNAKYTFWEQSDKAIRNLSVYAGWGKAVKLPSFEVLYPTPTYTDNLSFAPGTMADGTTFYAYYTIPTKAIYNPDLKWQHNKQIEVGAEMNIKGVKISLSAYRNKIFNPYIRTSSYTGYSYKLTDQRALNDCLIPSVDRRYVIDQQTGIVTVHDRNNILESEQLSYTTRESFKSNAIYKNGSPAERKGLEWVIDFPQINSLRTSFRIDGNYYHYKGTEQTVTEYRASGEMADRRPYRYIGYYPGSSSSSNGSITKSVNTNLTAKTHIPAIRMIFSVKLEASLYRYSRRLSEYNGQSYGFVLDTPESLFGNDKNIYQGDVYVGSYPLYYSTWDDPNTLIPFAEAFANARENDTALYNELAKLVNKSNTNYYFNADKISPYFAAKISITKEIGNFASISFYAENFFHNMALVKSSANNTESSLYNSSYIPNFDYGLTLRIKL